MAASSGPLPTVKVQDKTLPIGFTQQDADFLKERKVPTRDKVDPSAKCQIVITRRNGLNPIESRVYISGASSDTTPKYFWSDNPDVAKANKDAECKAGADILNQVGDLSTGLVQNAVTIYVLGSPGPCRACRDKLKHWASSCNARLVCVYRSESSTDPNAVVGGNNGFEDAEQWNGLWVCVPAAVAAQKQQESSQLDPNSKKMFQSWLDTWQKTKSANSGPLSTLSPKQKGKLLQIETDKNETYLPDLKKALSNT